MVESIFRGGFFGQIRLETLPEEAAPRHDSGATAIAGGWQAHDVAESEARHAARDGPRSWRIFRARGRRAALVGATGIIVGNRERRSCTKPWRTASLLKASPQGEGVHPSPMGTLSATSTSEVEPPCRTRSDGVAVRVAGRRKKGSSWRARPTNQAGGYRDPEELQ